MHIERGSEWNRWDFHVHTPYSVLNNGFGFNPDPDYEQDEKQFDEYVKQLFERALESGVVAIGITDYFSIDGYRRIRNEYLNKPMKMEMLFPDKESREAIHRIFVFPNIEFRIGTFIGRKANAVNYHVLLSDKISCSDIESLFLSQLHIKHSMGQDYPLNRRSIGLIGQEYKRFNETDGSDYRVGLDHITVDENEILSLLSGSVFKEKYMISIPVDENLSTEVPWKGRDAISRKLLYQQSHCLMTSNEKTIAWALGRDGVNEQIAEFGSLKPCIWGSDAHTIDRMYKPDQDRYCWIKAEPTFEGLQQILYEPAERVKIQIDCPEEKDEHQIIDYILFEDPDFQSEPVYFNPGLNCIIGGKSTGKSILLRHVAKAIDPKTVLKREEEVGHRSMLNTSASVRWKDGESGERKIIYIPQSWLNSTVDERGGSSEINGIIQSVLLQDTQIGDAYRKLKDRVAHTLESVEHDILSYMTAIKNADEREIQLKSDGRSKSYENTVSELEKKRNSLTEAAGITPEKIVQYGELEITELNLKNKSNELEREKQIIEKLPMPGVFIKGLTELDNNNGLKYNLENLPDAETILSDALAEMQMAMLPIWENAVYESKQIIEQLVQGNSVSARVVSEEIIPLRRLIAASEDLKKLELQLNKEREKLALAQKREKERDDYLKSAREFKSKIIMSRNLLNKEYNDFSSIVSKVNQTDTELQFGIQIDNRSHDLFEAINSIFNTRGFRTFKEEYGHNLSDEQEFIINEKLFEDLFTALENGEIVCKGGFTKQTALEQLFGDWFYIHYIVKSDEDTIDMMSPGKKALVLLELIVNLENGNCPILIDQPEDDLDNRSIFTDLVKYLKEKKHERQIIVVTHNANVVVGADAEEVIIANQVGKESENYSKRFEYRCGAIENDRPVYENGTIRRGILNQKGIQEQICDILEGGKDAFELRRNKYFSTT